MNILLVIFVCATCVLCHPVSDPEIPSKSVPKTTRIEDTSENDISLKKDGGVIVDEPATSETSAKEILNDLEEKGVKIIQDIVTKIKNGMKINETENGDTNSEKLLKAAEPEVIEIITEKENKNDAPEFPIYDYVADAYMFNNQNPSNVDAKVENPDESVFHIVPFGIETSEMMPNNPMLDRNVNKLENENKQIPLDQQSIKTSENEEKFVKIPLNVQIPNQEDRYLPDIDIRDTNLNYSSLNYPILSPYDTLPLNTSPEPVSVGNDKTKGETVNQFLREDVVEDPVSQDTEFHNSEDNFIPNDYDDVTYQDYNPNEKIPMSYNYDYDFQERNLPGPPYNQMTMMMNSHNMNSRPFHQPFNMGSNYPSRSVSNTKIGFTSHYKNNRPSHQPQNMGSNYPSHFMNNPRNEISAIVYSNGPKTPQIPVNNNNTSLKMSNEELSSLIEQIFPGIFKNSYPQNSNKGITSYIDTYPEGTAIRENEIPANYEKKPQEFIIEIGNMKPAAESNYNPSSLMEQDDYDTQSFGIKPVKEVLNMESDINEEITNQPIEESDLDPYNGYRIYSPFYHHSMYMSPEEYSFHYPNKQFMQRPYYNDFPEPINGHNMGPQGYFPLRNRVPYLPGPMTDTPMMPGNPMMTGNLMNIPFNYPTNSYDNNNIRNNNWRFPTPNQYYMNYNRFVPNGYNRYPVPPY